MGRLRVAVRTPSGEGRQLVVLRLAACTGRGKKRHCFQLVLGQPGGAQQAAVCWDSELRRGDPGPG